MSGSGDEVTPRVWEAVLGHIERGLARGELVLGGRLPSERTLAAELGVGRSSVREAIRALEILGLIRTQTGSGPTAGATLINSAALGMTALMRLQLAAQNFAVDDILQTRLLLEGHTARTLAAHSRELHEARRILDAMDDPDLSAEEFLRLDAAFHLSLAESSGNAVIAATMSGLRSAIESYVTLGARRLPNWPTTAQRLRAEHRGILAAIEAGDAEQASRGIHEHISGYVAETDLHRTIARQEH